MANANILFIVSVSWSVETWEDIPINYRLPSNRASDDNDDDDEVMIQKCSLNPLKLEYLVTDGLYFHFIQ